MNLQVGVKALLRNSDGKVLLLRRNKEKYPEVNNLWDIPGGRIDTGATLYENLSREILEETGLVMNSVPRLVSAQDIIKSERELHVVRLTYTARVEGNPILSGEEHDEYLWASFSEITNMEGLDSLVRGLVEGGVITEDSWS